LSIKIALPISLYYNAESEGLTAPIAPRFVVRVTQNAIYVALDDAYAMRLMLFAHYLCMKN
jgi:hypothetical protein